MAVATAFFALHHVSSADQFTMDPRIAHDNSVRVRRSTGEHRVTANTLAQAAAAASDGPQWT
jgi:hypothetical protein